MAMTLDDVYKKVQKVLGDSLGVDEDEVTPEARLTEDLGAESIDYLDIAFRLEQVFGITIDASELVMTNVVSNPTYVRDGRFTDAGLEELRLRFPHLDLKKLDESRSIGDLMNVFTVETLVRFVWTKLAACP
jgi:acyl carrier protein